MSKTITSFRDAMTRLRRTTARNGTEIEFWSAREVYTELGYEKWENFVDVIGKARENCEKVGENSRHHFAEVRKMKTVGKGAHREQADFVLTRTGCYLIALNADASKEEVAWAKAYFLVQTRAAETKAPALTEAQERLQLREKLTEANRQLGGAAKEAGVENFAFFHAAGTRGLYGINLTELKKNKGLSEKDDYWDRVCSLELSANEFKAQLTKKTLEQKKKAGEIHGQKQAEKEHERIGKTVRETVRKETGIFLENLPPVQSLKKLLSEQKKQAKQLKSASDSPSSSD